MHLTEDTIPEQFKLRVHHMHPNNSSRSARGAKKYSTIAAIYDRDTGEFICKGFSKCSKTDAPRRSIGRQVAVGRALKALESIITETPTQGTEVHA